MTERQTTGDDFVVVVEFILRMIMIMFGILGCCTIVGALVGIPLIKFAISTDWGKCFKL